MALSSSRSTDASADTRAKIMAAAVETLKTEGIAGTSTRAIGRTGDFNQTLIHYHFGSLMNLLLEACTARSESRADTYAERLQGATTMKEVVDTARVLHREDVADGNITVLTQMLAAIPTEPEIGARLGEAFQPWIDNVESALDRVVGDSRFADLVPSKDLAYAVSAMFLGMELLHHLDPDSGRDESLFDALEELGGMIEQMLNLGPLTGTAVRRRLDKGRKN